MAPAPELTLGRVDSRHPRLLERCNRQQPVAQLGERHAPRLFERHAVGASLEQQSVQRLGGVRRRRWRDIRRRLGLVLLVDRVACDHRHVLGVRHPHVPHVPVAPQQLGVLAEQLVARIHSSLLLESVRRNALQQQRADDAQRPEAHLGQLEQLGVLLAAELDRAQRSGRHERHRHHLLVDRRNQRPGPVRAHLREASQLLLAYRGKVLQRQAMLPQLLGELLDRDAGLDAHLRLGLVDVQHTIAQANVHHAGTRESDSIR